MSIRPRTAIVLVLLLLLAAFAVLNWTAFTASTALNLLVAQVEAPLGVIMLAVVAAMTALYTLFALYIETNALLETRRQARELEAQRKLAAEAEVSRVTELRAYLEAELAALRAAPAETLREMTSSIERAESTLKGELERVGNTLAAYIGELEDRLLHRDQPPS